MHLQALANAGDDHDHADTMLVAVVAPALHVIMTSSLHSALHASVIQTYMGGSQN